MEDEQDFDYQVNLRIEDVRLLQHCVNETIRLWPGAPARPAEEQEHLRYLRDSLFRMSADYNFREL
jgi:hypothetical protein|tara:strand:- start:47 stop:244 length:198 start_codon:yes stop_codon:yes gene_type:complete